MKTIFFVVFTVSFVHVLAETIGYCDDFIIGTSETWPYFLDATTITDGAASQAAQTFTMNVTSLPEGGANYRIYKTTENGSHYFGNLTALVIGNNSFTVPAVDFDRTVKFHFSNKNKKSNILFTICLCFD